MRIWRRRNRPKGRNAVSGADFVGLQGELSDAPLDDPAADRLGRRSFAQRLASTLAERQDRSSIVVGLYGPWGDGKSTVLGFVENFLHTRGGDVKVVKFNPWLYADELQVFEEFFYVMATAIGAELLTARERAGKYVRKAGNLAEGASIGNSAVRAGGGLVGAVGELLGRPTLRNLRDRLQEVFESDAFVANPVRIVVLMDDIDRLDSVQITTVFRMIKLAADFPYVSYLVAFDHEVVAKALGMRYQDGGFETGAAFLEKIVQVPLRLPPADSSLVAKLMNDSLQEILKRYQIVLSLEETSRLQYALDTCIWPHIKTLRSGKRLLNSVDFAIPIMRGEVNAVDQILLEGLRLLFPAAYDHVAVSKHEFLASPSGQDWKSQVKAGIERVLALAPEASHSGGRLLLQSLFPHLEAIYENRYYGNEQALKWAQQKRVCSPSHFNRYFAYGLPVGDILDADVQKVIDLDESEGVNWLRLLLHGDNDAGLVIQKLLEHAPGLDSAASVRLASAIAEVGAELSVSASPIQPESPTLRAGYAISLLLRNVNAGDRESVTSEVLNRADRAFAAIVFSWIESASGPDGPGGPLLSVEALERAGITLARNLVSMAPDELMSASRIRIIPMMCRVCRNYGQLEMMIEKLVAAMGGDPIRLRDFLAMFLVSIPGLSVNAINRNGYAQLNAVIPAGRIVPLVREHFPSLAEAADTYRQAIPGSPEQQQFIDSPYAPVVIFMALYSAIDNVRPIIPSTVFDPSSQRSAHLMNLARGSFPQHDAEKRPILGIRATVIRPADASASASAGLTVASQVDEQTRERVLREMVASVSLGRTLTAVREYWSASDLSDWTFAGTNSGDVSNLFIQSSAEEEGLPDISAHFYLSTGWYGRGADQIPSPGILGWIEVSLRKRAESSRVDVSQFRDLLVDSMGVIDITYKASNSFLPPGPYEAGEVALWVGTSASGLDAIVDMETFPVLPGNPPRNEIQVFSALPLEDPVYNPLLVTDSQAQLDSKKRLAVEMITRSIQWSGRRDYAPAMHQLLRSDS